jgi:CHAT domain-containing protein
LRQAQGGLLGLRRQRGPAATAQAVLDALGSAGVVHFACHGVARPTQPTESFLLMANDERLTVRALASRAGGRLSADLVLLSACETAVAGTVAIDEVVNFPTAFLELGASAAIGSLWVAPDEATALLMVRFYWSWRSNGLGLPEALAEAQRWLRDATNAEIVAWLRESAPDNTGNRRLAELRSRKAPNAQPYSNPAFSGRIRVRGTRDGRQSTARALTLERRP